MKKNLLNKRKKNIFKISLYFLLFFFFILIIFSYIFFNYKKLSNNLNRIVQNYSDQYQYNLLNVKINNLNFITEENILNYFDLYINKSIFLVPLDKIATEIRQNVWVKNIEIISNYKNMLLVDIEEEIPLGIYDNGNQKIIFSKSLKVIEIIDDSFKYNDLIIFYGLGSINNSNQLFENLDKEMLYFLKSADFIANRRWNIKLKNNIILMLPEENINKAFKNYLKIYTNFSNKDLEGIESIDLRLNEKAIIKYQGKKND